MNIRLSIIILFVYAFVFFFSAIGLVNKKIGGKKGYRATKEYFDPRLTSINTVDRLAAFTDSICHKKGILHDTAAYVDQLGDIIQWRFKKGIASYTVKSNWILSLAGTLFWSHLSAVVDPNDLMKFNEGLCSQQTIVFTEVLKRKNIPYRTVGLGYPEGPGHFLCEVEYTGSWHLYDVTLEPKLNDFKWRHQSTEHYRKNLEELYSAYDSIISKDLINTLIEKVNYGEPNQFPAKKMLFVHKVSFFLLWFIPLLTGILLFRQIRKMFHNR